MKAISTSRYVYLVFQSHPLPQGQEDSKLIGVFESERDAQEAVNPANKRPGFCAFPDGFIVDRYELGREHWTEGFVGPEIKK